MHFKNVNQHCRSAYTNKVPYPIDMIFPSKPYWDFRSANPAALYASRVRIGAVFISCSCPSLSAPLGTSLSKSDSSATAVATCAERQIGRGDITCAEFHYVFHYMSCFCIGVGAGGGRRRWLLTIIICNLRWQALYTQNLQVTFTIHSRFFTKGSLAETEGFLDALEGMGRTTSGTAGTGLYNIGCQYEVSGGAREVKVRESAVW